MKNWGIEDLHTRTEERRIQWHTSQPPPEELLNRTSELNERKSELNEETLPNLCPMMTMIMCISLIPTPEYICGLCDVLVFLFCLMTREPGRRLGSELLIVHKNTQRAGSDLKERKWAWVIRWLAFWMSLVSGDSPPRVFYLLSLLHQPTEEWNGRTRLLEPSDHAIRALSKRREMSNRSAVLWNEQASYPRQNGKRWNDHWHLNRTERVKYR